MPDAVSNRRAHDRLQLGVHDVARFIEGRSDRTVRLLDLGYGGVRLARRGLLLPPDTGIVLEGELEVLGARCPATLRTTHQSLQWLGCQFEHKDPATLLFLRQFLEAARWGGTLAPIGKDLVREEYQASEWLVMHGDGPVTLRARCTRDEPAELEELSLTIRPGGYYFIDYAHQGLSGGQIVEGATGLKSAHQAKTVALPPAFLRRAVFVLLGAPTPQLVHFFSPAIAAINSWIARQGTESIIRNSD